MRFTVLGSGTLLPDDHRHSPAHLVEVDGATLLLDCGYGTVHGFDRHRVSWRTLSHLALTHFHMDHVGDLAPFLFALRHGVRPPRETPLVLLGPVGLGGLLERLRAAHGDFVTDPGFPLEIVELSDGGSWDEPAGRFRLEAHATPHTPTSLAYRVEAGGGALGYTGDTGPSEALGSFFAGVALLVAECSLADPPEGSNHLSPRSLARLALAAGPRLLVVTHLYPPLRAHKLPGLLREAGYEGEVVVAVDGTRIGVGPGNAVLQAS